MAKKINGELYCTVYSILHIEAIRVKSLMRSLLKNWNEI